MSGLKAIFVTSCGSESAVHRREAMLQAVDGCKVNVEQVRPGGKTKATDS